MLDRVRERIHDTGLAASIGYIILVLIVPFSFAALFLRFGSLSSGDIIRILTILLVTALVLLGYDAMRVAGLLGGGGEVPEASRSTSENEREGFEGMIEIAGEESPRAEQLLQKVRTQGSDPFNQLSNMLDLAARVPLNRYIIQRTVSNLNRLIEMKRFVEQVTDDEMRVVNFEDDIIHAQSGNRTQFLQEGMMFDVVELRSSPSGNDIPEPIGTAHVNLTNPNNELVRMKIHDWEPNTGPIDIDELRDNRLSGRRVRVRIRDRENLMDLDLDKVATMRDELQTLYQSGSLEEV